MAIKEYTIPKGVTPSMFEAWKEEEANHKRTQKKTIFEKKQEELQKQALIKEFFPSFATSNKIEGYQAIDGEIEKLKKNYRTYEDQLRRSLDTFFSNKALAYAGDDLIGMLNYEKFNDTYLKEFYKDTINADLIDKWLQTTDGLYYWLSKKQDEEGNLTPDINRWQWATNPGVLYSKILEANNNNVDFGDVSNLDNANTFLNHIKWEYVENNSLIKDYVIGNIYSFKNGAFKYKGGFDGGAANPSNWERIK